MYTRCKENSWWLGQFCQFAVLSCLTSSAPGMRWSHMQSKELGRRCYVQGNSDICFNLKRKKQKNYAN